MLPDLTVDDNTAATPSKYRLDKEVMKHSYPEQQNMVIHV